MRDMNVAAIQMTSGTDVDANLAIARRLIGQAAAQGAELVLLPEYFGILGASSVQRQAVQEREGDGMQQAFLAGMAKEHRIYLIGGCVPLRTLETPDQQIEKVLVPAGEVSPRRARSACLAYGPEGQRLARYDKIHLFRFARGNEHYDEAVMIEPGQQAAAFDAPCGRVGLSICYDLRFPELYRTLGAVDLIVVPAAFTATTGQAHWEVLLRARAIENQCYVLAAAQTGRHPDGRMTYGHSMLIDPWGEVLACLGEGEGVVQGTLRRLRLAEVREQLPALQHRVFR